jgi:hypothetical protein
MTFSFAGTVSYEKGIHGFRAGTRAVTNPIMDGEAQEDWPDLHSPNMEEG